MAEAAKSEAAPASAAAQGSALARASAMAGDLQGRIKAMPPGRRRWMGASTLLVLALAAGMLWYAGQTDWRVLFSGLDAKDTQQIAQELSAAGIVYELTPDGSGIQVAADQVDKARMEVASKGMPQTGRMGFELFDKPNWVGSEFDEKVNYQRALEGELEHTIGTLAVVRSARVHIVMPKESLFAEGERAAKASVVLKLKRSEMLPEQAELIRSLVAGAVENLSPGDVTLVDADGRLNLSVPTEGAVSGNAERALEEKLVAMLEPTAGRDNVRATVTVSYDEGSVEKTDEVYDPTLVAALSLHKSAQTLGPQSRVAGVPGTASNTPGAVATGSAQAAAGAATAAAASPSAAKPAAVPPLMQVAAPGAQTAATGPAQKDAGLPVYPQSGSQSGETITDETGSYAVTRHLSHSEDGPGRVRRLTAAVVVNDRMESEGAGKLAHTVWKPRSPDEMKRLEELARAAVGFDTTRGDQLVIENVSFSSNVPEAPPPAMEKLMDETSTVLHLEPGLLKTLSFSAISLLLIVMVLKPMTRQMMTTLGQTSPMALEAGSGGAEAFGQAGGVAARFGVPRPRDAQGVYQHVSEQIRREPAQSTRLLETWISAPVEDED
jgi:flagellar M-ring protein FliF